MTDVFQLRKAMIAVTTNVVVATVDKIPGNLLAEVASMTFTNSPRTTSPNMASDMP
jgi:hypothetical protein